MATHPHYPKLYEGPPDDGEPTWYCSGDDVPKGALRRIASDGKWERTMRLGVAYPVRIYQVKQVPEPAPEGLENATGTITTTVARILNRRDLDHWQRMTERGNWVPIEHQWLRQTPTGFGLTIRRRS